MYESLNEEIVERLEYLYPTNQDKLSIINTLIQIVGSQMLWMGNVANNPNLLPDIFLQTLAMAINNTSAFYYGDRKYITHAINARMMNEYEEHMWEMHTRRTIEGIYARLFEDSSV